MKECIVVGLHSDHQFFSRLQTIDDLYLERFGIFSPPPAHHPPQVRGAD